jgi:hypothetical protein
MKKSEILKQVLARVGNGAYSNFICIEISHLFITSRPSYGAGVATKANKLITWITKSLGDGFEPPSIFGVEAWLVNQGHKRCITFGNNYDDYLMLEYRKRWLTNMIEYWKARGD